MDQSQQESGQGQDTAQSPIPAVPAGISGQEASDIQDKLDAQPEQAPGTPGVSIEQRIQRIEEHLGLDRVYVHDVTQPGTD